MDFLVKWIVVPVLRYVWDLLTMPYRLRKVLFNHLHEFAQWQARVDRRLDMIAEDMAEQKGICKATREIGRCPPQHHPWSQGDP